MKIIDNKPHVWFLLENDGSYLLDVNGSMSFVSYSFAIELPVEETAKYASQGREYINQLAYDILNSVPISRTTRSIYKDRNVHDQFSDEMSNAIERWRAEKA